MSYPTDDTEKLILTAGDRLRLPQATLTDSAGVPLNLAGLTLTFRMTDARTADVYVNDQPARSIQTDADPATWGRCVYEWGPNDTAVPGLYRAWFGVTAGGLTSHFPPDGGFYVLIVPGY